MKVFSIKLTVQCELILFDSSSTVSTYITYDFPYIAAAPASAIKKQNCIHINETTS